MSKEELAKRKESWKQMRKILNETRAKEMAFREVQAMQAKAKKQQDKHLIALGKVRYLLLIQVAF